MGCTKRKRNEIYVCSGGFGGRPRRTPPAQNFLYFMQFFTKLAKSYVGAPSPPPREGWCPLLRRILDPPLVCVPNSKKIVPFSRQLVLELGSRSHCITPTPKCNDHVNWIQIQLLFAMDPRLALVAFKSISSIN